MNKKIWLAITLIIAINTYGQQGEQAQSTIKVTGTVVDNDTKQALEYATVSFYNARKQKVVDGGITDEKGVFSIKIPAGMYRITFEYISFETKTLLKQKLFKDTNLGTIALSLNTESLEDVVIIAEKTTVEIKLDKKIYNVGKDLTVRGGTVSDVLDNVPSVSVDVEGNVALRGNDNVRILINGKPSGLVGLNSTEALRQLPAESIERVEVITSPSARYDAEGTAGILNIILRRSKLQGLNGAVTANTAFPWSAGISGNLNYRTGDLNFFTTSGYNYRESPGNSLTKTRYIHNNTPETSLIETRDFDRKRLNFNTNFGVEWYLNNRSSIVLSYLYRYSDENNNATNMIQELNANQVVINTFNRFDPELEDDYNRQLSVNYTKDFNTSGHQLTLDFQVENNNEEEDSKITQDNFSKIELVNTKEDQNEILLQSDYVLPIGEKSQFELGYRGTFNELKTDYLVQDEENGMVTTNMNLTNNLRYVEQVNAMYSQYGSKIGKLSYLLGLRMESTRIIIDQETSSDFNRKNYIDFFPTVNIGYELSEKQSITLGYNRRVRRPRSRFINPFPSRSSATNLFQGNPDLDPSYANTFDIGYLNRMRKVTVNSSVYYNRSTQVFTFISEDTGELTTIGDNRTDSIPVLRRTPINIASTDRYGFEFTTTYNPTKKWRINGNFNAFQVITRGNYEGESLDAENLSWFARINNKLTLPTKVDWQTILFYRGPSENAQTKSQGIFTMNVALSKDFFKEKASLTFNVNDVFNSRKRIRISTTPTFTSESEFQWRERSFTLAFTYRFNQKKKRERSGRGENGSEDEFEG